MYQSPVAGQYPGKLQAIAILQTVFGGLQILGSFLGAIYVLFLGIATFGIGLLAIPIPIAYLIVGILSLVSGIKGLQRNPSYGLGIGVAICQLCAILVCDVLSFGCGLASLILIMQQEVKAFFGK
jgi:hypothetical protein